MGGGKLNIYELNEVANNEYLIKDIAETFLLLNDNPTPNEYERKIKPVIKDINEAMTLILLSIGVPKKYIKLFYLNCYENTTKKQIGLLDTEHRQAFKKVNNICCICGTTENLTIHHTKPNKYLKFNYNNMVVLCQECHRKHHTEILNISELMKQSNINYGGIIWNENNKPNIYKGGNECQNK